MSGGVDSSVAAALLKEQGHEVVGAYMKNWINEENIAGHCPWQEDIDDAEAVARQLGIEFHVVNLIRDYRERVVKYLLAGYEGGITPNPDVMCNREMKFGVFLDWALAEGFEGVATGHYCRIARRDDGSADILRGADPNKDQSYFLALLRQEQIRRAHFPVGEMRKPEVRAKAEELGLKTAGKKDSQGICFIGEVRMKDFLAAFVDDDPGAIVTVEGERLGEHRGLHLYTLGQRKGLGVASPVYKEPYVVVAKRAETKELVVGFDKAETPGLYTRHCRIGSLSFTNREVDDGAVILAQARYRTAAEPARVERDGEAFELVFDAPQRALTPGQICAFYEGGILLGGGVFERVGAPAPALA
ncbi:tRNA 2-thiouridine(34) synthase MnmA [soil metagenome]